MAHQRKSEVFENVVLSLQHVSEAGKHVVDGVTENVQSVTTQIHGVAESVQHHATDIGMALSGNIDEKLKHTATARAEANLMAALQARQSRVLFVISISLALFEALLIQQKLSDTVWMLQVVIFSFSTLIAILILDRLAKDLVARGHKRAEAIYILLAPRETKFELLCFCWGWVFLFSWPALAPLRAFRAFRVLWLPPSPLSRTCLLWVVCVCALVSVVSSSELCWVSLVCVLVRLPNPRGHAPPRLSVSLCLSLSFSL